MSDRDTPPTRTARGRAGSYELLFELAAGGMATVYLAHGADGRVPDPLVAVKRLHRHLALDKMFLAMMIDEAKLASRIDHPNVVRVRELVWEDDEPFIALDYVEGTSLSDLRKVLSTRDRVLHPRLALRIVIDALLGLHAAHTLKDAEGKPRPIVHRDVSPHNVLVGVDGIARITDFGIAKAADRIQDTRTHEVKGKLGYLAPERIDRRRICTAQSDVFSMGIVAWECLAGRRMFKGEGALDTLQEIASASIPKLRQVGAPVSPAIDRAIARALSRDLRTRYATAQDFATALAEAGGADGLASREEVGELVVALFDRPLRDRHDQVRAVVGSLGAEAMFVASGLESRLSALAAPVPSHEATLARLALPIAADRYDAAPLHETTTELVAPPAPPDSTRRRWPAAVAGALAVIAAAAVVIGALASRARQADAPVATASALTRKVLLRLPFVATGVTVDGVDHAISPTSDSVALVLPSEAPTRHAVSVTAIDGGRFEGTFVEHGAEARLEGELLGASQVDRGAPSPASAVPTSSVAAHAAATRPASSATLRKPGGFTRLP